MADFLNAFDKAALSGPVLAPNLSHALQVNLLTGGVINIASRVITLNSTRCRLHNWNKKLSKTIEWPRITWQVNNADGFFSPNASGNIWGADRPSQCSLAMTISMVEPGRVLVLDSFPILRVELLKDTKVANIYATTHAAALLAKEQSRDDMRWEVDFDTNSVTEKRSIL